MYAFVIFHVLCVPGSVVAVRGIKSFTFLDLNEYVWDGFPVKRKEDISVFFKTKRKVSTIIQMYLFIELLSYVLAIFRLLSIAATNFS